jgi:hypothetical protein
MSDFIAEEFAKCKMEYGKQRERIRILEGVLSKVLKQRDDLLTSEEIKRDLNKELLSDMIALIGEHGIN